MMYTMLESGYTVGKVTDMEEKRQVCVCARAQEETDIKLI